MVLTNSNNAVVKINYYVAANVYIIINFLQMHIFVMCCIIYVYLQRLRIFLRKHFKEIHCVLIFQLKQGVWGLRVLFYKMIL
jgi:hypothetical protein